MTVAKIQEYIDEQLNDVNKISILGYRKAFREIKSMLDELEQPQEIIDEQREKYITDGVLDELEPKENNK